MIRIRGILALAVVPAAVAGAQRYESSDFRWSERIDAGRTVKVSNINGTVTMRAGSGDRVEVTAVKRWRQGDPSTVRIYAARENGDIRVCALYERQQRCDQDDQYGRRDRRDRDDRRDDDVAVDFTVTMPRGVHVVAATVNGPVSVSGATEDVSAVTVNGDVSVESGRGRLNATTVQGTVNGVVETRPAAMEFTTVNGSVIVALAKHIGVDVEMTTLNGNLRSDYDVVAQSGRWNPFNLSAHVGPSGGPRMRVTTVNGNVELRKR